MGEFVKAKIIIFSKVPLPQEEEAIGLKFTIKWLGELQLSSGIIETDCLSVVDGMNSSSSYNSNLLYVNKKNIS